jgi:hypothetical protein
MKTKTVLMVLAVVPLLASLALAEGPSATTQAGAAGAGSGEKMIREPTEWVQMDVPAATATNLPRVLLVGDSIVAQYFGAVVERLKGKAYCAKFSTSASVADPLFLKQLDAMFVGYEYAVVQFNNGLHGFGYTEAEYEAGYRKAVALIREKAPKAKLVLALTTPIRATDDRLKFNPRVEARNAFVTTLATEVGAGVDDLFAISNGHPELYSDSHHYKKEGIALQADRVAACVAALLPAQAERQTGER